MKVIGSKIIECAYDGIGDAVTYCWMAHGARVAGQDVRLNLPRFGELAWTFGVDDLITTEPANRFFTDFGNGSAHSAAEFRVAWTPGEASRFDSWCEFHGLGKIAPVRPIYNEHPRIGQRCEEHWTARDLARNAEVGGKHRGRVLIQPECAWPNRTWPSGYYVDLANKLHSEGYNVVTIAMNGDLAHKFPYFFVADGRVLTLLDAIAMSKRADFVICNDSGPAHWSGTVGTRTYAISGPTRPDLVFGHMSGDVIGLCLDREVLPCTGCHFKQDRGFRPACGSGCQSLMRLGPEMVYETIMEMEDARTRECQAGGHSGDGAFLPFGCNRTRTGSEADGDGHQNGSVQREDRRIGVM